MAVEQAARENGLREAAMRHMFPHAEPPVRYEELSLDAQRKVDARADFGRMCAEENALRLGRTMILDSSWRELASRLQSRMEGRKGQ
jgi:hypothetical protein